MIILGGEDFYLIDKWGPEPPGDERCAFCDAGPYIEGNGVHVYLPNDTLFAAGRMCHNCMNIYKDKFADNQKVTLEDALKADILDGEYDKWLDDIQEDDNYPPDEEPVKPKAVVPDEPQLIEEREV